MSDADRQAQISAIESAMQQVSGTPAAPAPSPDPVEPVTPDAPAPEAAEPAATAITQAPAQAVQQVRDEIAELAEVLESELGEPGKRAAKALGDKLGRIEQAISSLAAASRPVLADAEARANEQLRKSFDAKVPGLIDAGNPKDPNWVAIESKARQMARNLVAAGEAVDADEVVQLAYERVKGTLKAPAKPSKAAELVSQRRSAFSPQGVSSPETAEAFGGRKYSTSEYEHLRNIEKAMAGVSNVG